MGELFDTMITLMQKYTLADTANVFAIVEGIATVVAAIGAIIAVILTKKIANEQIRIANKQNDISAIQANIAKQQNSIALLNQRMEILNDLDNFFREWELIHYAFQSSDIKKHSMLCRETLFIRTCTKRKKLARKMNLFDYLDLQSEQIDYDTKMFDRIPHLFELNEELKRFIDSLKEYYINLSLLITDRMQSEESEDSFSIVVYRYIEFFEKNKKKLIDSLEAQTKLYLNKQEV